MSKSPPPGLTKEDLELINPIDFQSIETHIVLTNQATKSTISDKNAIKVIEFLEEGIVIEAPGKVAARGHLVAIQFIIAGGGVDPLTFESTAKVEEAKTNELDHCDRLELKFMQHDYEKWKKVQDLFASRQNQIEEFFKAAKG